MSDDDEGSRYVAYLCQTLSLWALHKGRVEVLGAHYKEVVVVIFTLAVAFLPRFPEADGIGPPAVIAKSTPIPRA